jgi:signal transduction histidine kinase
MYLSPGDAVELEICNDCAPLSGDEFAQICDRFYRAPGSTGLGAGLGLSIVSRIAQQHGASFFATPREDGSGFCARLIFSGALV